LPIPAGKKEEESVAGLSSPAMPVKLTIGQQVMSHRGIALAAALLGSLAFCTNAAPNSLDLIPNETLRAYAESELEYGAPSIPVASRILYRDALRLLREGDKEAAVRNLELAANLTGDYAAPLFVLARIDLFSANPNFLFHLTEGLKRVFLSYPAQAVLAANAAATVILALIGALLATLIALLIRYRAFIDHKIAEACADHTLLPPPRWTIGLVIVALLLMRLGLALYIAILVIVLWVFMSRREKGIIVALIILLSAASFSARYSNCLAPALDPESAASRFALVNRRGVNEECIARIASITDGRFRAQKDFALGTMMYRFGAFEEARRYLLESVSVRPDFSSAFLNLGNVYFMHGDYDKALAGYQSALELDSANAVAHYNIGQTYIKKMLFAQSGEWLERATIHGIEAYRSAHPALSMRNPPVYEEGFRSRELWAIAVAEGKTRRGILMSDMLQPLLLFPFQWLWVLLAASLAVSAILARRLPEAWLVGRCDNCGKPTCTACVDTQTGIGLCRSCAEVIRGLSSIKVMEALLRTRRQKIAAIKQKRRSWKMLFFPGVSHTYYGNTFSGASLSLLGAGALALLAHGGPYFSDPYSMSAIEPVWNILPPAAALLAGYLLSFRAKSAPQEQGRYHIFPTEIRMQAQEREREKAHAKAEAPKDPWKEYEWEKASSERAKPADSGAQEPKKAPPREEVLIGEIEKGSTWH
jgi:tetratricopeptide (TPR) repeat protein